MNNRADENAMLEMILRLRILCYEERTLISDWNPTNAFVKPSPEQGLFAARDLRRRYSLAFTCTGSPRAQDRGGLGRLLPIPEIAAMSDSPYAVRQGEFRL